MKRILLTIVALFSRSTTAHDWKASHIERQLGVTQGETARFLVSKISEETSWCITIIDGGNDIKLRRCDFDTVSDSQLWVAGLDNKIFSPFNDSKCLTVTNNRNVQLRNCDNATVFSFDEVGHIRVDDSYCLTNRGVNPNPTDPILAKKCLDRPDYEWEAVSKAQHVFQDIMIRGSGGCLQPRGSRVYLDNCNEELVWKFEFVQGNFLLHSAVDDSMCLRAGRGGTFNNRARMRLTKCDRQDALQHISIGPTTNSLHVGQYFDFCIEYAGITPNVGNDIIVLKPCDLFKPAKPWNLEISSTGQRPCILSDAPEFKIDNNGNIGDTLLHPGPGFARSCGMDCYQVKDSGDDPPFDPELGDTLRFAYKKVSSRYFSIRSKVCGVDCDGADGYSGYFGRTGLMVRETLDPFSKNIFASHSPNGQADWSYRIEDEGETVDGMDGSPDVPCLWITLERIDDDFLFSYAYEGQHTCDMESLSDLNGRVSIDMSDEVFIGLAVSTGVAPPYCSYTEAEFRHIECIGCEDAAP